MRVYEIAKEVGIPNKDLIAKIRALGLEVNNHMSSLDADDVARVDRFSRQVAFLKEHPRVAVLGAAVEWINAEGRSLFVSTNPTGDKEIKNDLFLNRRCVFWHPTVLMRREVWEQIGGYRAQLMGAEDYDFWLRAAERFELANLGETLVRYRIHSGQVSIQRRLQQTRSTLAAQLSAKRRRAGSPDPVGEVKEVTAGNLVDWGISYAEQQSEVFADYRKWIRMMCDAGEYLSALRAAQEAVEGSDEEVERWQVADVHMMIAKILWQRRRVLESLSSVARAILVRPAMVGRPLRRLWSNHAE